MKSSLTLSRKTKGTLLPVDSSATTRKTAKCIGRKLVRIQLIWNELYTTPNIIRINKYQIHYQWGSWRCDHRMSMYTCYYLKEASASTGQQWYWSSLNKVYAQLEQQFLSQQSYKSNLLDSFSVTNSNVDDCNYKKRPSWSLNEICKYLTKNGHKKNSFSMRLKWSHLPSLNWLCSKYKHKKVFKHWFYIYQ